MQKVIGKYQNGNYTVTMLSDGTKIRRTEEDDFIPTFSENTDVTITRKCGMNCQFCLTGDEKIITSKGKKEIKDLMVGDLVYSLNKNTGDTEIKPIIETYVREYNGDLIEIETDYGKLVCTPNHRVYTRNRGYVEAGNLQLTDELLFF